MLFWFSQILCFKPKKRVYLKLSRRENIYMKARKDFIEMKLKAGIFPPRCSKTGGGVFPSVRICVKESVGMCRPQDERRRICSVAL